MTTWAGSALLPARQDAPPFAALMTSRRMI